LLNRDDLIVLEDVPGFNDIDLQELVEYFEKYICANEFTYECLNEVGKPTTIVIKAIPGNFAHLSGVDKCAAPHYGALNITNHLRDGSWSKSHISGLDQSNNKTTTNYKDAKVRMRYLATVYKLLQNPSVIQFNPNNVVKGTWIKSKYLMSGVIGNRWVHLGVDVPEEFVEGTIPEVTFPRTLLIEKTEKFIDNQYEYAVNEVLIKSKAIDDGVEAVVETSEIN